MDKNKKKSKPARTRQPSLVAVLQAQIAMLNEHLDAMRRAVDREHAHRSARIEAQAAHIKDLQAMKLVMPKVLNFTGGETAPIRCLRCGHRDAWDGGLEVEVCNCPPGDRQLARVPEIIKRPDFYQTKSGLRVLTQEMRLRPVETLRFVCVVHGLEAATDLRRLWAEDNPVPDGVGDQARALCQQHRDTQELLDRAKANVGISEAAWRGRSETRQAMTQREVPG